MLLYATYVTDAGIDSIGVPAIAREPARAAELGSALLLLRFFIGAALAAVLAAAGLWLMPQPEGAVLAGYAMALPLRALTARWVLVGLGRPGPVAAARVAGELLGLLLVLVFVRSSGDLENVPLTQVAGDALAAVIVLAALRRLGTSFAARYRHDVAAPFASASWQMVVSSVLALLIFNCDLLLLRAFEDSTTVGWYAAAYTLVSFFTNLGATFAVSVMPVLARLEKDAESERGLYQASLGAAAGVTLPLAAGGTMLATGIILLVYGEGFIAGGPALAVLLWTLPPAWFRMVAQSALVSRGRQADVLRATAVAAGLTVALDLVVIPRYGMLGAAWVTVGAETVRSLLTMRYASRMGLELPGMTRYWRVALAALAMVAVELALPDLPVVAAIGIGAVVYSAGLLLTGAIRPRRSGPPLLQF